MSEKKLIPVIALFLLMVTVNGCKYPLLLLSAVAIHELAHIDAAWALGGSIRFKPATAAGLVLEYDCRHLSPAKEAVIASAGIAVNLTAAGMLLALCDLGNADVFFCFAANLSLGVLNLLPVGGFDGAIILSLILGRMGDASLAGRISATVSDVLTVAFAAATIYYHLHVGLNLSMLMLSLHLNLGLVGDAVERRRA